MLCEYGELTDKDLYEMTSTLKSTVDNLVQKGLVGTRKIEISRLSYTFKKGEREAVVLSDEQQGAFDTLKSLYHENEARAALLYGITGSGKTSVIKRMIDEAIDNGSGWKRADGADRFFASAR